MSCSFTDLTEQLNKKPPALRANFPCNQIFPYNSSDICQVCRVKSYLGTVKRMQQEESSGSPTKTIANSAKAERGNGARAALLADMELLKHCSSFAAIHFHSVCCVEIAPETLAAQSLISVLSPRNPESCISLLSASYRTNY